MPVDLLTQQQPLGLGYQVEILDPESVQRLPSEESETLIFSPIRIGPAPARPFSVLVSLKHKGSTG